HRQRASVTVTATARVLRGCRVRHWAVSSSSMFGRWILPIVAALAMLCSAVSGIAAAGAMGEPACCCPSPDRCKCHDHDGTPKPSTLRRCSGELTLVAPALACFELSEPIAVAHHAPRPLVAELPVPTMRTSQCWLKVDTP